VARLNKIVRSEIQSYWPEMPRRSSPRDPLEVTREFSASTKARPDIEAQAYWLRGRLSAAKKRRGHAAALPMARRAHASSRALSTAAVLARAQWHRRYMEATKLNTTHNGFHRDRPRTRRRTHVDMRSLQGLSAEDRWATSLDFYDPGSGRLCLCRESQVTRRLRWHERRSAVTFEATDGDRSVVAHAARSRSIDAAVVRCPFTESGLWPTGNRSPFRVRCTFGFAARVCLGRRDGSARAIGWAGEPADVAPRTLLPSIGVKLSPRAM
jgi:hypothetical protein